MFRSRTIISTAWSLTRQQHGEQPFWMATTLAAMLGQIGLPGAQTAQTPASCRRIVSTGAAHWLPAYVGIGSNLDDPGRHVRRAVDDIAAMTGVCCVSVSSFYRSAPMGPADQPDFVNAVVAMLTTRSARELLSGLQSIETTHGRVRSGERWGPRTLDLDILVYGGQVINEPDLTVPHRPGQPPRRYPSDAPSAVPSTSSGLPTAATWLRVMCVYRAVV